MPLVHLLSFVLTQKKETKKKSRTKNRLRLFVRLGFFKLAFFFVASLSRISKILKNFRILFILKNFENSALFCLFPTGQTTFFCVGRGFYFSLFISFTSGLVRVVELHTNNTCLRLNVMKQTYLLIFTFSNILFKRKISISDTKYQVKRITIQDFDIF